MPAVLRMLCLLLAACGGPADQRVVEWREADRLFLADGRNGIVRVFDIRNGPVPYGQLTARERRSVRDMRLDAAAAELWVLGDDALYRYDVRLLALLERRELPRRRRLGNAGTGRRGGIPRLGDAAPALGLAHRQPGSQPDSWRRMCSITLPCSSCGLNRMISASSLTFTVCPGGQ